MNDTTVSRILSWIARIWSIVSILFVLIFLLGEGISSDRVRPTPAEWIGLAFWPGGVLLGLIAAWFRERLGGTLATSCLIAFYVWHLLDRGTFPRGPYFLLVAIPGILFLLSSLVSRPPQQMRPV